MTSFARIDAACQSQGIPIGPANAQEEPTPILQPIPPADPFPVSAMGPLKDAALAIHDKVQAPVAIGAQSLLSAVSLATQALYDVRTLGGTRPLSLFALTIAKSGERKSSCDALAMQPVRDFERELAATYKDEQRLFRDETEFWDSARTKLIREASGRDTNKRAGAKADLDALGPEPASPLLPFLTATDPTFEGLTKNLDLSRPSLGIFSDEAGQFLGGYAMNSDNRMKTIAGLSKFWDGAPINRARAGDGIVTFYGRRLCAHLMVQPIIAETLLSDPIARDQGFLPRFLMCHPASTIGTRTRDQYSNGSDLALEDYGRRMSALLRAELPLVEGSRNELDLPILSLDPDADRLLREFAYAIEKKQAPGEELCDDTAFASKSAEHAARIAGVLTVYAGETSVSVERMTNGIDLADWYLSEAVRLRGGAAISLEAKRAEKLRVWLLERWPEEFVSVTPIVQAGAANVRTAKEVRTLIPHLERNGWLMPAEAGAIVQSKHRKEAWFVVRGLT